MGTKSIQVPEEFHAYVKANNRDDETMADTLIRLTGGPHPSAVVGLVSAETAEAMQETIAERGNEDTKHRKRAAALFETTDDS